MFDPVKGNIVLIDFGIAVFLEHCNTPLRLLDYGYSGGSDMAPELAAHVRNETNPRPITCAADVYALGAIFGQLVFAHNKQVTSKYITHPVALVYNHVLFLNNLLLHTLPPVVVHSPSPRVFFSNKYTKTYTCTHSYSSLHPLADFIHTEMKSFPPSLRNYL